MRRMRMMPIFLAAMAAFSLLSLIRPAKAVTTNLKVGYKDGFGIYQSVNKDGEAQGIHIDLMNALAEELSFSVEYIPFSNDAQCYQALEAGEIDLVLGISPGITEQYAFLEVDALSDYSLCVLADDETAEKPKNN